jgi:hypothetical protein
MFGQKWEVSPIFNSKAVSYPQLKPYQAPTIGALGDVKIKTLICVKLRY